MSTRFRRSTATLVSTVLVLAVALAIATRADDENGTPAELGEQTTPCTPPATSSTSRTSTTTSSVPMTTAPPKVEPAVAVWQGDQTQRVVALTFDCGSDAGSAEEILDILTANHIVATFGMTGSWATAHPALVRRMVDDGHQLVNHSYDHPSFTGRSTGTPPLTRAQRLDQLTSAELAIQRAAGVTTQPWFRPPYGDEDASVRADIALAGYRYELMWTVDSLGWRGLAPEAVVQRCLDLAAPGAIYLFHVGAASTDHLALQEIIDGLRSQGYAFVTASALIE